VVAELAKGAPADAASVRAKLASCGLPSDYARLGQPLSTVVELLVQSQSGARRAISFASRTKPYLSIAESYATPSRTSCGSSRRERCRCRTQRSTALRAATSSCTKRTPERFPRLPATR
jgi:hypothetical protein